MARQKRPNGQGTYIKLKDGRVAWRQMVDGETRQVSAKTPKLLQVKVKKIADLPIIKEKYTVAEWFENWLEIYVRPLKKAATYDQYKTMFEQHIRPEIGKRKLSTLKTYDIQAVISKMNEKGLSTKTMKHAKNVMNLALKKAEFEQIIAKNPVNLLEIPVKQAKPRKTLTTEELKDFMDTLKNSRWIWSVRFLLITGLRRGELLALRWSDIDMINRRATINKSYSVNGIGDTKSAQERFIPLSDRAIEYLNAQKTMLQNEFNPSLFRDDLKDDPLVFPSENGTPMRPDSYSGSIRRLAEKKGLHVTPHMMRHTFVYLTRGNLSLKDLQSILGHSESTTTLDIYGDMINDSMSENIKKIDHVFKDVEKAMADIEKKKNEKKDGKVIEFRKVR